MMIVFYLMWNINTNIVLLRLMFQWNFSEQVPLLCCDYSFSNW